MDALIAALCTVLAHHIPDDSLPGSILQMPNLTGNLLLYSKILSALDMANVQAKEADFTSKIAICHHLHAQV